MIKLAHVLALILGAALLAGCQNDRDRLRFDGQYFRTKVRDVDGQRDEFTVTIRDVSRSLMGARLAGRHAGISYCVGNYGNSDIDWVVGPQTPAQRLVVRNDRLVFRGTCPQ